MLRTIDIVSYLFLLTLFVLAFLSPWLPPREGPPVKRRIRIRTLMILIAIIAIFTPAVIDLFRPIPSVLSWNGHRHVTYLPSYWDLLREGLSSQLGKLRHVL